jgi:SAM-dependent methyltransferase
MSDHMDKESLKGRADDRPLWDIDWGMLAGPAVLVAYDLKLFPLLAEKPRTLAQVCSALNITPRAARALLSTCTALELVQVKGEVYMLTPTSEEYLLETSPTYFGGYLDLLIETNSLVSFESVKTAVLTNSAQVYGTGDLFKSHEEQTALAGAFTRAMHGHSMSSALAWPGLIDLSGYQLMLDVGGGSAAHAIGAAQRWSHLRATVLDIAPVCQVADEFIARHGLQDRITTQIGDMWTDPFPSADLHFYSDIFHDWPPEKCQFLTRKSFESLTPGGRLIIHEILYNDTKAGPLAAAAYNIAMLLNTQGQQYSARELSVMLTEAGFTDIESMPTFGYWSMVSGRKP